MQACFRRYSGMICADPKPKIVITKGITYQVYVMGSVASLQEPSFGNSSSAARIRPIVIPILSRLTFEISTGVVRRQPYIPCGVPSGIKGYIFCNFPRKKVPFIFPCSIIKIPADNRLSISESSSMIKMSPSCNVSSLSKNVPHISDSQKHIIMTVLLKIPVVPKEA